MKKFKVFGLTILIFCIVTFIFYKMNVCILSENIASDSNSISFDSLLYAALAACPIFLLLLIPVIFRECFSDEEK